MSPGIQSTQSIWCFVKYTWKAWLFFSSVVLILAQPLRTPSFSHITSKGILVSQYTDSLSRFTTQTMLWLIIMLWLVQHCQIQTYASHRFNYKCSNSHIKKNKEGKNLIYFNSKYFHLNYVIKIFLNYNILHYFFILSSQSSMYQFRHILSNHKRIIASGYHKWTVQV